MAINRKLTPHFNLSEFWVSDTASRHGINNYPPEDIIENITKTAKHLEIIRNFYKKVIIITSGYRCLALNRLLLSSDHSAHVVGLAVDFKVKGMMVGDAAATLAHVLKTMKYPFDQLILEYGWIHLGFVTKGIPRQMLLTKASKDAPFIPGIHTSQIDVIFK